MTGKASGARRARARTHVAEGATTAGGTAERACATGSAWLRPLTTWRPKRALRLWLPLLPTAPERGAAAFPAATAERAAATESVAAVHGHVHRVHPTASARLAVPTSTAAAASSAAAAAAATIATKSRGAATATPAAAAES